METKHGASLSTRQRDADDASGRVTSFCIEERGSRALRKVAGVSIVKISQQDFALKR